MDLFLKIKNKTVKCSLFGQNNVNSKLTDEKVMAIRRMYLNKEANQYELAKLFGVTQATIGGIVRNERWRHIA